jgi:urea transporter
MTAVNETKHSASASAAGNIPAPVLAVFRGIGQVFFQENALTGVLFVLGIAFSSPLMAAGVLVGSAIGTATARLLKFNESEVLAGIYGFNSALVGIATLFFFQPGVVSIVLLIVGCVVAALLTRLMRGYVPFSTYTTPFIVTTWALYFLGLALKAAPVDPSAGALVPNVAVPYVVEATTHGIGQVMFQASLWTGLLFLLGIAVSDREHASWVLVGSIVGMLVASHHVTAVTKALDPERLVERDLFANIALGLYGYNATLAPVALFLWRRKLIPSLLGMLLSVPLTELVPLLGLPALTAPFVLATWLVLALGWLEGRLFGERVSSA